MLELVEYLYTHGVTHLFLDEVHRYLTWVREIKNIYDSYPDLHIVFTGSSLLEINQAEADLSRRLHTYELRGLSFREYLAINGIAELPVYALDDILTSHQQIASSLVSELKLLPHFEKYIQQGYYPFLLETTSADSYYERLRNVINTVIDYDIPAVEKDINYLSSCFIVGEPLYLDDFVRDGNPPTLFVVGNKGGLTEARLVRE